MVARRAYFLVCLALGRLLRSARYSRTQAGDQHAQVRKSRRSYAPLLIWIGSPLMKLLKTGVRILPQREWEERERLIYQTLHGRSIEVEAGGVLVLPRLAGQTLATLLDDPKLDLSHRRLAIESAASALAEFHRLGFTHGDAMAENVLIDSYAAHWFDFETVHESSRPAAWHRADDVRALLATCLIRTAPEQREETIALMLDTYADEGVTRVMASSFTSVWRRSLPFHLAQAPMTFHAFKEIGVLLFAQRAYTLTTSYASQLRDPVGSV
jgi:serine/threonine protein kinase